MLEKKDLAAVHKQDIKALLKNWGLLDAFEQKKIKCKFCSTIIAEDNFGVVFSKNKQIFFVCSALDCLAKSSR